MIRWRFIRQRLPGAIAVVGLVALACGACGRLGFDGLRLGEDGPGLDGSDVDVDASADGPGEGGSADAPVDGASVQCDPHAAFGAPVLVAGLVSAQDDVTLRLTPDELFGAFWSGRSGTDELYIASRPDRASAFTVTQLDGLGSSSLDADPTFTEDAAYLVFSSYRAGVGGSDLYQAQKSGATYANPQLITAVDTGDDEIQPNWSPAENALYFSTNRTGIVRIFRAALVAPGMYASPVQAIDLVTAADANDPVPSADGLALYFRSTRAGGPGGGDVFVETRASLGDTFGPATLVEGVGSPQIDGPSFISPDQCRLYFTSDRSGIAKIYVAAR